MFASKVGHRRDHLVVVACFFLGCESFMIILTPESALTHGINVVGVGPKRSMAYLDRSFREHFGVSPKTAATAWNRLVLNHHLETRITGELKDLTQFFWTLFFLKTYETEGRMHSRFKADEKTIRNACKKFYKAIACLYDDFIVFPDDPDPNDPRPMLLISVDGTDFRIQEPGKFDSKWFSHKLKKAALRYELALDMHGHIVHTSPPYKAGTPDINIFRDELKGKLPPNRYAVADDGYKDEKCLRKSDTDSNKVYEFLNRKSGRHETINSRYKSFGILGQTYRHHLIDHVDIFEAITVLIEIGICHGEYSWKNEY